MFSNQGPAVTRHRIPGPRTPASLAKAVPSRPPAADSANR